ncbi:hypothetical protein OG455_27780 [Kitasatospora sp. NBC_01287]|uniref:hypothetical protein n=1 Tax=Kitasatospora sp. NBC_01287 TaxID=2903573 RepID=UPI0022522DC6|nr:hypothetical protein [Kitasatospora sp. NBC_01287]MCX4749262.1 hypothetical protein [Kitasatospora sp. NBC_01287]
MTIAAAHANAVFTAATAARWTTTNLGRVAHVRHGGETWTVALPPMGADPQPVKAEITWRESWSGADYVGVHATWLQTIEIVEAAAAATRVL